MKLIALTGLPRTGKDTMAQHLMDHYGYVRKSFADPLKVAASVLLNRPLSQCQGLDGFDREAVMPEWGFSMRWFLQRLGTECLRYQISADFWVTRMSLELTTLDGRVPDSTSQEPPSELKVVITDCRFFNELLMVRNLGGTLIEIRRPGIVGSDHLSDKGLPESAVDLVVTNKGSLVEFLTTIDNLAACYDW